MLIEPIPTLPIIPCELPMGSFQTQILIIEVLVYEILQPMLTNF